MTASIRGLIDMLATNEGIRMTVTTRILLVMAVVMFAFPTSVDTRRTHLYRIRDLTDSAWASSEAVFPESSTTPLLTEATLMPLPEIR